MLQKVRQKAFWFYDGIMGSKVGNHIKDISNLLNANSDSSKNMTDEYLVELLTHAASTTEYYSDQKKKTSIKNFQVINKKIIRKNFEQFISNSFERDHLKLAVTSGSTGTPFEILQNTKKILRNTADTIYFGKMAGYTIGQRLYYFKIWNEENEKNFLTSFLQNVVPIDVMNQSSVFFDKFLTDLENDKTQKSFLGYASFFEALCKYLDRKGVDQLHSNVNTIITMAEALNSYTKQRLEKYFGKKVVSRYSNTENGILAQQKVGEGAGFHLNTASYYFELLEMDSNSPVPLGKPGRIVITDLFNYGMPLIRYDTGDIGIFELNATGKIILGKVEGRKMDLIYDTQGQLVSSFVITNNMWKYANIKQYQFVQESKDGYRFILNVDNEFYREKELINEFSNYFGSEAKIRIEYESTIPILSSGKRKKVVNKM